MKDDDLGHQFTLGASSDGFFDECGKIGHFGWTDLAFSTSTIAKTGSPPQHTTTNATLPSTGIAISLHGQTIGATNQWRRGSLWSHARRAWSGLAARWLVHLFGATKRDASKNREMGVALSLGGRHLIGRYNNQIGFGDRGRRDVGEEVLPGWSVWGDVMASIWAAI